MCILILLVTYSDIVIVYEWMDQQLPIVIYYKAIAKGSKLERKKKYMKP